MPLERSRKEAINSNTSTPLSEQLQQIKHTQFWQISKN